MGKGLRTLLAGVAAGAALGILFSPGKGKQVRQNLKKELGEGGTGLKTLKKTVTEVGQDLGSSAKGTYEDVKKSPQYKKGKEEAKRAVKRTASKAKRKVSRKVEK